MWHVNMIQGRLRARRSLLFLFLLVLAFPFFAEGGGRGNGDVYREGYRSSTQPVPGYAREVFAYVLKNGRAPHGYVGDRVWHNRERRLPPGVDYREYDVHPKIRGVNRGPERIIVDRPAGKGWYTGDHYRTFVPIGAK
jgi:guanyl-specific ribonuclease Sa